ncbi:MAG: Membrane-bound lytic murein transglycosylase C precursor [Lentisphaerae bacterium ADurb.Bin242]|nr:MAG: Membrane-bound lytic murein transglycosylase C precursor [Lentisphaerae bacterium ADurb.Bin242]
MLAYGVQKGDRRRKKSTYLLLLLLISVFAVCAAFLLWRVVEKAVDYFTRSTKYDGIIYTAGIRNGVDPYLIKAVIWRESRFDRTARGLKGEIGLMQIRPDFSAVDWAKARGFEAPSRGALFDPELNIEIGAWYLGKALRRHRFYRDSVALALCDYNAGARRTDDWKPADPNASMQGRITIPSTRSYVEDILAKYREYRRKANLKE